MVDARGGAMRGCRHSGVRVIIPPRKAPMPMRITCRYLRKEKLIHPPPLMEGEACASRILEVGPAGAKFLGPVIIEVPHFASLRGKEREVIVLRSDNGETWKEHTLEATEDAVQEVLQESFEGREDVGNLEEFTSDRITRILTTDFPQYFAIVTRIKQEVHAIGPEGGLVNSSVVPQVQAIFPEGALTKKIKVGLQAHPIRSELVEKLFGNRVAVSPIVTIEPRRRKFHRPITLTIPLPVSTSGGGGTGKHGIYSGESSPTLRLLCSITGGTTKAQWEDVTGSTPLTFVNACVSFTTTVSARFWLMDCRQVNDATKFATELYKEAIHVPFMSKFVIFAKRHQPDEAHMRVFCMTDDKEEKTLEHQEHFTEVAKSRDVEVLENKPQYVEFAGNLTPVTKQGEQLSLTFHAFRENRLPIVVRVKDADQEPAGRIAFMREQRHTKHEPPQQPICNLSIVLPEVCQEDHRLTPSPRRRPTPSPEAIGREDVHSRELQSAMDRIDDHREMDTLEREMGLPSKAASRGTTLGRDAMPSDTGLGVPLDDKDIMKDAESAEESGSDGGGASFVKERPVDRHVIQEKRSTQREVQPTADTQVKTTETTEVLGDGHVQHTITAVTKTTVVQESEEPVHLELAKQIESETWLSEQDTSQVSVSSLPQDSASSGTDSHATAAQASVPFIPREDRGDVEMIVEQRGGHIESIKEEESGGTSKSSDRLNTEQFADCLVTDIILQAKQIVLTRQGSQAAQGDNV